MGIKLDDKLKIGLLMQGYAHCPIAHTLVRSFSDSLCSRRDDNENLDLVMYCGYGSQERLLREIRLLLASQPDLLYATSTRVALMARDEMLSQNLAVPIICAGIADPSSVGLMPASGRSDFPLTGVQGSSNVIERHVMILQRVHSRMRRILCLYDPSQKGGQLAFEYLELARVCRQNGLELFGEMLLPETNLVTLLARYRTRIDTLFVLRDGTVLQYFSFLSSWCSAEQIVLVTSDRASVARGAACGYGEDFQPYGTFGADLAEKILFQKASASDLPFIQYQGRHQLVINPAAARRQGLEVDPLVAALIGVSELNPAAEIDQPLDW